MYESSRINKVNGQNLCGCKCQVFEQQKLVTKMFMSLEFLFPKSFNNKKPIIFAEIVRKTIPKGLYSTLS